MRRWRSAWYVATRVRVISTWHACHVDLADYNSAVRVCRRQGRGQTSRVLGLRFRVQKASWKNVKLLNRAIDRLLRASVRRGRAA